MTPNLTGKVLDANSVQDLKEQMENAITIIGELPREAANDFYEEHYLYLRDRLAKAGVPEEDLRKYDEEVDTFFDG